MRRHFILSGNDVRFGSACAALVVVAALPVTAIGAERVVLGEYFNALW